ncbi:RsmB/NOP family class I SAM-dependent RNA methyltransferase [Solimonas marina]|uniref:RsmB/NOP family class I SAM-dependent RNA methyltransferase n=1 Tax=Solimonas marina TaxID=2714601 RepID=A0A969WB52_9GAMM|nr:RsmB/NOP family class I SAM-dependent RNA methyltransferase [Solimonas marina]NKF22773.1 RsmB/NOP family class I SAM-dependent RNA methyltransferase [Solimonas marina]
MSAPLPRLRPPHWRAAVAVLARTLEAREPADAVLQHWFREHREMGGRDRANVSALVYGALRDAMRLQRLAGNDAALLLAIHVRRTGRLDRHALAALADEPLAMAAERACEAAPEPTAAEHANVPEAIWSAWQAQYGDDAVALAAALNHEAPVDVRVNTLKATREAVLAAFAQAGIDAAPTPLSPWGLRLARRVALPTLAAYRDGWLEPQDEGSQMLAHFVDARPGERVADFCAGAGGKTLALGATMANDGELWALDIAAKRLAKLGPRAQRAGLDIVQACSLPDPDWLAAHAGQFDAVLVDAPCSATGTWRRNPELRLRPVDFEALAQVQGQILAQAAPLLRPGGRLIYATCSLMSVENDAVVEHFLADHPQFFEGGGDASRLRLRPDRHGTDGFFAARLQRALHGDT